MGEFDFGVIQRSLGYLFREGMTFTLTLTGIAACPAAKRFAALIVEAATEAGMPADAAFLFPETVTFTVWLPGPDVR